MLIHHLPGRQQASGEWICLGGLSHIFEVVEPDDIETPQQVARELKAILSRLSVQSPPETAPAVCIIDSGIQEEYFLLEPGIDKTAAHCFLPGVSDTEVADYVRPGGHGTRVAGPDIPSQSVTATPRLRLRLHQARADDGE